MILERLTDEQGRRWERTENGWRFQKKSKPKRPKTKRRRREQLRQNRLKAWKYAAGLRSHMTRHEKILLQALDEAGIYVKPQASFFDENKVYITDFRLACDQYKLVIEVDGDSHKGREDYDAQRTAWLRKERNCRVLRFTNNEVERDAAAIVNQILTHKPKMKSQHDIDKLMGCAFMRTPEAQ